MWTPRVTWESLTRAAVSEISGETEVSPCVQPAAPLQTGVRPDGDERHGDRGPDRRRSHHGKVSRRLSSRARALPSRGSSQPLAGAVWCRAGAREGEQHGHQRPGVPLDLPAYGLGQRVLPQPPGLEVDQGPGTWRTLAVDTVTSWRGGRPDPPGCLCSRQHNNRANRTSHHGPGSDV